MDATEWLTAFAQRLGAPEPTPGEIEAVLALAGVAAHGSERIAAPVSCWMAARAGVDLPQAMVAARQVSDDG
jgi:Domain of unknown function (DUF6457)